MYFKYFSHLILVLFVFVSCDDIDRDNVLDPKNPASERPQVIAVEAFVNTNNTIPNPYNEHLLNALDQLESIYGDKITVAEFHRSILPDYPDTYSLNANEILYGQYYNYFLNLDPNTIKGVPDVYINGTEFRVQGASSAASVLLRLQHVIDPLISQNAYFTIEENITNEGNEYKILVNIARLGSTDAADIMVKAVIINQFDNDLHERVVTNNLKSQEIRNISNGEIKEIDLGDVSILPVNSEVIIMITSADELQIFQSKKVDLN